MKISIEGTSDEIERVKSVLDSTCLFNSEFCITDMTCRECEKKQEFEVKYIVKNS